MKGIIVPLVISLVLCGCGNYSEIEDATLVSGLAVDKGEQDNYKVTVEIVNLNQGEGEQPSAMLISGEGPTVYSALENINAATPKQLFFSHAKVIAISEEVAKEGLIDIIDVIVRDNELRITNDVVVAKECKAAQLFTAADSGNPIRSYEIAALLGNESNTVSVVPRVRVFELINIIGSSGVSAILPAFGYWESDRENSLKVSGAAVFKEDKLVSFLDTKQSKIMSLLQGQTKEGIISQPIKTETKEYMTVKIFESKTDIDHSRTDGKVVMNIDVNMVVGINELTVKENVMDEKGRNELIKKLENSIKSDIESFVYEMQAAKTDVFGFGERIYKENPDLWEKLRKTDYFPELEINTKVKVKLRGTGFIAKSPSSEDFRLKEG